MRILVGTYLVDKCGACGKYVRLNKWLLGSLHLCTAQAELRHEYEMAQMDAERRRRLGDDQRKPRSPGL